MVYGWGSERFPRYNTFYERKGVGPAPRGPPWDPRSMSLNAPHHKEQEYIWFMGGDLNGFQDIMHFMKRAGGACPRGTQGSMSLNAAYHREQQYISFMGGDLNSFRDITFYEMKGVGHGPGGPFWDPWSISLNAPHHKEQAYTVDSRYLDPSYLDPITYVELISKSRLYSLCIYCISASLMSNYFYVDTSAISSIIFSP